MKNLGVRWLGLLILFLSVGGGFAQTIPPMPIQWFYFPPGLDAGFGYPPLAYSANLAPVSDDGCGLFLDTQNLSPAFLNYNVQETVPVANRNINYSLGTLLLYFAPNWASVTQGGSGPGQTAYLLAGGDFSSNAPHGLLTISIDAGGSNLCFGGVGNGDAGIYMSAPISWSSNAYHQIGVEWTGPGGDCEMYVDGALVATGNGVEHVPARSTWTNGFYFGSMNTGYGQARGSFLEAYTWNVEVGGVYTNDWLAISNEIVAWQTAQAATSSGGMMATESASGGSFGVMMGVGTDDRSPSLPAVPLVTTISSNAWFSQIIISNHPYVSLSAAFLDANGQPGNTLIPLGVMFPLTSTNLAIPLRQWQPVGQTNSIQPVTFNLPYNTNLLSAFYGLELQINPTFDTNAIAPYSAVAANPQILSDYGISLDWTNKQFGNADELEAIVEVDESGHFYLVNSVITHGASGTYSFEAPGINGITFVRYWAPANAPGDQFFVLTNYVTGLDVFTVPYIVDTTTGRVITDVSVYDVTASRNQQFLGHISGNNCFQGTLQIPGLSMYPGVDTIEFRALDASGGQTATDMTITNNRLVSVVSPIFELAPNSANQIPASLGSYKVTFEAVTTATNGTWTVEVQNPDGSVVWTGTAPVTSVGQDILFDDGGTPSTLYPVPYYQVTVSVATENDPETNVFWVTLLPPRGNAGSITGYDKWVLPSSSSDKQFVLQVLQDGVSGLFNFVYYTIDFGDGHWKAVNNPAAISLDDNWGWRALQAGLSGLSYEVAAIPGLPFGQWLTNQPDRPILGLAVESHGGEQNGTVIGLQGPTNMADTAVTAQTLQDNFGFNKATNAVAIAILTGCELGNSTFMNFILRNQGVNGQIDPDTATTKGIRPCFGLGWTTETYAGSDQFGWVSYFTLFATELGNGPNGAPFFYTLDGAFNQANQTYTGFGGQGSIWSGVGGKTLDKFSR